MDRLMYSSKDILEHWERCLPKDTVNHQAHLENAEKVSNQFQNWKLETLPISEILNFSNSPLENEFFFNERVEKYLMLTTKAEDIPTVILTPIDRKTKNHIFLENRYSDPNIKWEPADGFHRIQMFVKLGKQFIPAFIPIGDTDES